MAEKVGVTAIVHITHVDKAVGPTMKIKQGLKEVLQSVVWQL